MVSRGEQRGEQVDIEGADVLVAGGRGLGRAEGFELCEELAKAFGPGSAVAATRAVVDAGWYPYAGQIGQTGKTVAPKLYFAAGISGAIQHKVGMQASENIVAVNKDANAPISKPSNPPPNSVYSNPRSLTSCAIASTIGCANPGGPLTRYTRAAP